jgi:hypothetical protein
VNCGDFKAKTLALPCSGTIANIGLATDSVGPQKRGGGCAKSPKGVETMDKRFGTAACWLLIIPYIGLLWVPFYNSHDPVLWGFPYFYWYQLLWVPITSILIWIAYRSMRNDD